MIKRFYIVGRGMHFLRRDDVESVQWLDFSCSFAAMKDLYLTRQLSPYIVLALLGIIEEGVVEMLPSLRKLILEEQWPLGHVEDVTEQLVAMLRLSTCPMAVSLHLYLASSAHRTLSSIISFMRHQYSTSVAVFSLSETGTGSIYHFGGTVLSISFTVMNIVSLARLKMCKISIL